MIGRASQTHQDQMAICQSAMPIGKLNWQVRSAYRFFRALCDVFLVPPSTPCLVSNPGPAPKAAFLTLHA